MESWMHPQVVKLYADGVQPQVREKPTDYRKALVLSLQEQPLNFSSVAFGRIHGLTTSRVHAMLQSLVNDGVAVRVSFGEYRLTGRGYQVAGGYK